MPRRRARRLLITFQFLLLYSVIWTDYSIVDYYAFNSYYCIPSLRDLSLLGSPCRGFQFLLLYSGILVSFSTLFAFELIPFNSYYCIPLIYLVTIRDTKLAFNSYYCIHGSPVFLPAMNWLYTLSILIIVF